MPKNGSSRAKRRARRLAIEQNIPYTEALRRTETTSSEPGSSGDAQTAGAGQTVLDVLNTAVQQLQATDPADLSAVLQVAYESLDLTSAADQLLEETLLDADFARFWPGQNGLGPDRQKLEVALEWLWAAPSLPPMAVQHDQVTMLTPMDLALGLYPTTLSDPITHREIVELVLIQARVVAVAIRALWTHTGELLGQAVVHNRHIDDGKSCRVAALMVRELLHPEAINRQRPLRRRILLATEPERSQAELLADQALMNLLHTAAAATAHGRWSRMSEVTAACMKADPAWACERWGFKADIALVAATKAFAIQKVQRNGKTVILIRPRRQDRADGAGPRP